jgi:hypothetical protein
MAIDWIVVEDVSVIERKSLESVGANHCDYSVTCMIDDSGDVSLC